MTRQPATPAAQSPPTLSQPVLDRFSDLTQPQNTRVVELVDQIVPWVETLARIKYGTATSDVEKAWWGTAESEGDAKPFLEAVRRLEALIGKPAFLDGMLRLPASAFQAAELAMRERWVVEWSQHAKAELAALRREAVLTPERQTKEEREILVRNYLKEHKTRAAKGEVSIREVSEETGVPQSSVHNTVPWQALQARLEKQGRSRRPRRTRAQAYTNAMDAVVDAARERTLEQLINEQQDQYEPSPLDNGHRGKIRVKKKF
jgi:hypothetical protein